MNCDYTGWRPKHIRARAGENFSNSFCQTDGPLPKIGNFCNSVPSSRSFPSFSTNPSSNTFNFLSLLLRVTGENSSYQRGKKIKGKKEQKGKETVRRNNESFAFSPPKLQLFSHVCIFAILELPPTPPGLFKPPESPRLRG